MGESELCGPDPVFGTLRLGLWACWSLDVLLNVHVCHVVFVLYSQHQVHQDAVHCSADDAASIGKLVNISAHTETYCAALFVNA